MIHVHQLPADLAAEVEPLILARVAELRIEHPSSALGVMNGRGAWASPKMVCSSLVPMSLYTEPWWVAIVGHIESVCSGSFRLDAWANVLPPGASIGPHDHHQAEWSAVYYPSDHPSVFCAGEHDPPTIVHQPCRGDLLVFPGSLKHWTVPKNCIGDRVSIAVNCYREKE